MKEFWSKYKEHVDRSLSDIDELSVEAISFDMISAFGDLSAVLRKELSEEEVSLDKEKEKHIGKLIRSVALTELFFDLPNSLNSSFVGLPFQKIESAVTSLDIMCSVMEFLQLTLGNMSDDDLDTLQYNLNKFLSSLLVLTSNLGLQSIDCIKSGLEEEETKVEKNIVSSTDHEEEYNKASESLAIKGVTEVLLDLKVDKRVKKYVKVKGISVNYQNKITDFTSGDLIVDFFDVINFLGQYENYSINYSPKFRAYLEEIRSEIFSAFLCGDKIIPVTEVLKDKKSSNGLLTLGDKAKPILSKAGIKTLDNLLDYINTARKK